MAVIKYNGTEITCPSVQEYEGQQLVELQKILQLVETFIGEVTYYDPKEGKFITREMYWGDYSVSTYWVSENGTPKMFTGLKASLIDTGK